jgi:outer membrane receptor protein involved in Fe transport
MHRVMVPSHLRRGLSALLFLACTGVTQANPQSAQPAIEEVAVYGRAMQQLGSARSASEGLVAYDDLRLPPLLRVGELTEAVPGMVATQHSGTGKANQYFLRGFNLDHGTDFAASIDGVPINMRSHGHGQGYLDLNFMIPELIESTRYQKGPYHAEAGDFSAAGNVAFQHYASMPEDIVQLTLGEFGYQRGLLAGTIDTFNGSLTGALDITRYEGPWELSEDLDQRKGYLAWQQSIGNAQLRIGWQGYDSEWVATDQIPRRAVINGDLDPFGFVDPDLGGSTKRHALSASLTGDHWSAGAYHIDYDFSLYSNFTYFLENEKNGDEFEQRDQRTVTGLWGEASRSSALAGRDLTLRWGGDLRYDDVDAVGLYPTQARIRLSSVRDDSLTESSVSLWLSGDWQVTDHLRLTAGMRGDYYRWDVNAQLYENSGSGNDSLFSPKIGAAWRVSDGLELYANMGRGFHSNDVRGATISVDPSSGDAVDPVDVLIPADGAELGLRFEQSDRFNATLALFALKLDSELVYVGDAGTTEPNGATARHGIEVTAFWQATPWLALNTAYTTTDAKFERDSGDGRNIPGAVRDTFTLGANIAAQNGLSASARLRYLGSAPLTENDSVRSNSSWLLNAGIGWRPNAIELRLDVFNLLNSDNDDIAYFYESRLRDEAQGTEDIHFHPLEPRAARLSMTLHL